MRLRFPPEFWEAVEPDDTTGRTEPETVDVYGDQAPAKWIAEPLSDEMLDVDVRVRLGPWPASGW